MCNIFRTMRTLLIIVLLTGVTKTFGCSCIPATTKEYFEHAEVVFVGKVLDVIEESNFWSSFDYIRNPDKPRLITLAQIQIIESFKGLNEKLKFVSIPIDYSSCQYNFRKGGQYIIYANEIVSNPGIIMTGDCQGNVQIESLDNVQITALRELKKTVIPNQRSDNKDFSKTKEYYVEKVETDRFSWTIILLIISGVINLGLVIKILRK